MTAHNSDPSLPPGAPSVPAFGPAFSGDAPDPVSPAPSSGTSADARRRPGLLLAMSIAALALVIAFVSAGFAWRAMDQAKDAKTIALAGGRGPLGPTSQATGSAPPGTSPTSAATSDPPTGPPVDTTVTPGLPELNERTQYTVKYQKQPLIVRQARCNADVYVDLDEPRVGVGRDQADLVQALDCGAQSLSFQLGGGAQGSQSDTPGLTPQDCAERIRTAPLPADSAVPVRKGVVVCVITSLVSAQSRGDTQKMVLVEVGGVSDDKAVSVLVTAWNIPK